MEKTISKKGSAIRNYLLQNRLACIYATLFFILFPLLYSFATADPELQLRFMALSFVMLLSTALLFFFARPDSLSIFFSGGKTGITFFLFSFICLFSLVRSINPGDGYYEVSKLFLLSLLFFFLVYALRRSPDALRIFMFTANLSVILFSAFAIFQFVVILYQDFHHQAPLYIQRQVTSLFANKNFFAEVLFLFIPFSAYTALFYRQGGFFLSLAALALELLFIFITGSAAVWIGFSAGLLVVISMLLLYRKRMQEPVIKKSQLALLAIGMVVCMTILIASIRYIPALKNGVKPIEQKVQLFFYYLKNGDHAFENNERNTNSFYERLLMIRNSVKIIKENPVFGCGTGNWKIIHPKYGVAGTNYLNMGRLRFEHPHNDYLLVWCETGLPGICCWLGIFYFGFRSIRSQFKKSSNASDAYLMALLAMGITGFMVISLFSYPKERFYSIFLLILLLAIPASREPIQKASWHRYGRRIILACLFACSIISYIHLQRLKGEVYMKKALDYQHAGNMNAMRNQLMKARSFFFPIDMTATPLNWYIGLSSFHMGDSENAFRYFSQALDQNPYHIKVLNDLGTMYDRKGDYTKAIALYHRALSISPGNLQTILNMASVCYNAGKTEEAFDWIRSYGGNVRDKEYKTALKAILFKKADAYIQEKKDTLLAEYLTRELGKNENFLVQLFDSSGKQGLMLDQVSSAVSIKK